MPVEIDAFLAAYQPKFICIACLGAVTARDEADVRRTVEMLLAERRVETQVAECLNCTVCDAPSVATILAVQTRAVQGSLPEDLLRRLR